MTGDRADYLAQKKAMMDEHKAVKYHDRLVAALRDIVKCECPFSLDRLEHAHFAVEHMREIARAILAEIEADGQ